MNAITRIMQMPFDYFEGKGEPMPSVDVKPQETVLYVPPAFQPRQHRATDISVLMAMLSTNFAKWCSHSAEKTVRKARWGAFMEQMHETMVSQERWNNLASLGSVLGMGATFMAPKIADGIFGSGNEERPVWLAQKLWDATGMFPRQAIKRDEWRKSTVDVVKGVPQLIQTQTQISQQTGNQKVQLSSMQTQVEQEAMRNASEAASGIKQDDRGLRELIERTYIQGDVTMQIIQLGRA